jgi:hypothetical protein
MHIALSALLTTRRHVALLAGRERGPGEQLVADDADGRGFHEVGAVEADALFQDHVARTEVTTCDHKPLMNRGLIMHNSIATLCRELHTYWKIGGGVTQFFKEDYVFDSQNCTFDTILLIFCLRCEKDPHKRLFAPFFGHLPCVLSFFHEFEGFSAILSVF